MLSTEYLMLRVPKGKEMGIEAEIQVRYWSRRFNFVKKRVSRAKINHPSYKNIKTELQALISRESKVFFDDACRNNKKNKQLDYFTWQNSHARELWVNFEWNLFICTQQFIWFIQQSRLFTLNTLRASLSVPLSVICDNLRWKPLYL